MRELKPRDQIAQPEAIAVARFRSVEQLHDIAATVTLSESTPADVQRQFNIARHAFIYSWYYHDFISVASLYSFLAIELALSHRVATVRPELFKEDHKPTLYPLLLVAIKERWIVDSGFDLPHLDKLEVPETIAARFPDMPHDQRYCYSLLKWLPDLRNDAAHGKLSVVPGVSHELARAAELVNQLFPPHP